MRDIRIALAIQNSRVGDTAGNLARMEALAHAAARAGAAILCFPEMAVTGYHFAKPITRVAEPIPGPSLDMLSLLSRATNLTLLAGLAEKSTDGRIYASHAVITPDGIIGHYRKTHLGPPERSVFTAGDTAPIFHYQGVTFGIQLCYDAHFPELSTIMALKGAEVIFMPHASPRNNPEEKQRSWMRHLPARAFDNSVYVAACNPWGDNGWGLKFPGVGLAIRPDGEVLASLGAMGDDLLVTELTADFLSNIRKNPMSCFLPHRRPELYGGPAVEKTGDVV